MQRRSAFASRLTLWAFVCALVLKGAVPMLASAAAALQGKAVAEICDVYGVDTSMLASRAEAVPTVGAGAGMGHHHHEHTPMAEPAPPPQGDAPQPGSGRHHGGTGNDHCALSGMVAVGTGDTPALAARLSGGPSGSLVPSTGTSLYDAVARWATLVGHAPPAFS